MIKHPTEDLEVDEQLLAPREQIMLRRNPERFWEDQLALAQITDEEIDAYIQKRSQFEHTAVIQRRRHMLDNATRIADATELLPAGEGCDPLIELGRRWERELAASREDGHEDALDRAEAALNRALAIEDQIVALTPSSIAGALVQLRLLASVCEDNGYETEQLLCGHLAAFLTKMAAAGR